MQNGSPVLHSGWNFPVEFSSCKVRLMEVQMKAKLGKKSCSAKGEPMNEKKSHISLARYMVENLKDEELKHHKFLLSGKYSAGYQASFLYKRHEMDGTFPYVSRHIRRLSEGDALIRKKRGASITGIWDRSAIIWRIILHFRTTPFTRAA